MSKEIPQLKERITILQKNESDLQSSIRDLTAYKSKLTKEVAEFEIMHEQVESSLASTKTQFEFVTKELRTAEALLKHTIEDTEKYVERETVSRKKREMDTYTTIATLSDNERELKKTLVELQSKIDNLSVVEATTRGQLKSVEKQLQIVNGDLVESSKILSGYIVETEKIKSAQAVEQKKLEDILTQIEEKTPLLFKIDGKLNKVTEERSQLEAEKAEFNKVIASVNRQKEKVYKESLILEEKFKQLGVPVKLT
jgi:chromosome segregation ATPase